MARAGRKTLFEDDVRAMLGMPKPEHAKGQENVSLEKAFSHSANKEKMSSMKTSNLEEDMDLQGAFGPLSFCGNRRFLIGIGVVVLSAMALYFVLEEMNQTSRAAKHLAGPQVEHPRRGRGRGRAKRDGAAGQSVSRDNWKTFQKQADMETGQRKEMASEGRQHVRQARNAGMGKELEKHTFHRTAGRTRG
mmetsp:Transcript_40537/g.95473  ORF Transcript_40537/g.95473 Transcript_40537/m.95473 type:complete len:191 (-) Transcript_40537:190-762(-)